MLCNPGMPNLHKRQREGTLQLGSAWKNETHRIPDPTKAEINRTKDPKASDQPLPWPTEIKMKTWGEGEGLNGDSRFS